MAFLYFKNSTGDKINDTWRYGLCELLINKLSQSVYIRVLSQSQIYGILRRLKLIEQEDYTPEDLNKIASEGLATHIIQGSLHKTGENLRISLTLQNASKQEIIASENADGIGEGDIFKMVDELADSLKIDLGLTQQQISSDINRNLRDVTTNSPDAWKFYTQGYQLYISGDYLNAISYFERAVALDPQFGIAYYWLALSYFSASGGYTDEECRANIQKAFDVREKLSDRERYLIEAAYYHYSSEKTWDKAVEALSGLITLYPWERLGRWELAFLYWQMDEWDKAIEISGPLVRDRDDIPDPYQNLAWCYLAIGQPEKAKEVLEEYLVRFPDNGYILGCLGAVYCILEDFGKAKALIEKSYAQLPDQDKMGEVIYLASIEDFAALERLAEQLNTHPLAPAYIGVPSISYAFQGKLKAAVAVFDRDLKRFQGKADPSLLAWAFQKFGHFLAETGDLAGALSACEAALPYAQEATAKILECEVLYRRGVVLALQGDLQAATEAAEALYRHIESYPAKKRLRYYEGLLGLIDLKQKDAGSAREHLQKALSLTPIEDGMLFPCRPEFLNRLAEANEQTGRWEEAQKNFEDIQSRKFFSWFPANALILAKSYYKLGQVLEHLGDKAGAATKYRKFLNLWKDADPGTPEVEDARNRLAILSKS